MKRADVADASTSSAVSDISEPCRKLTLGFWRQYCGKGGQEIEQLGGKGRAAACLKSAPTYTRNKDPDRHAYEEGDAHGRRMKTVMDAKLFFQGDQRVNGFELDRLARRRARSRCKIEAPRDYGKERQKRNWAMHGGQAQHTNRDCLDGTIALGRSATRERSQ